MQLALHSASDGHSTIQEKPEVYRPVFTAWPIQGRSPYIRKKRKNVSSLDTEKKKSVMNQALPELRYRHGFRLGIPLPATFHTS